VRHSTTLQPSIQVAQQNLAPIQIHKAVKMFGEQLTTIHNSGKPPISLLANSFSFQKSSFHPCHGSQMEPSNGPRHGSGQLLLYLYWNNAKRSSLPAEYDFGGRSCRSFGNTRRNLPTPPKISLRQKRSSRPRIPDAVPALAPKTWVFSG
jgi:hypothetical protein